MQWDKVQLKLRKTLGKFHNRGFYDKEQKLSDFKSTILFKDVQELGSMQQSRVRSACEALFIIHDEFDDGLFVLCSISLSIRTLATFDVQSALETMKTWWSNTKKSLPKDFVDFTERCVEAYSSSRSMAFHSKG
jgi:hypothetical protein